MIIDRLDRLDASITALDGRLSLAAAQRRSWSVFVTMLVVHVLLVIAAFNIDGDSMGAMIAAFGTLASLGVWMSVCDRSLAQRIGRGIAAMSSLIFVLVVWMGVDDVEEFLLISLFGVIPYALAGFLAGRMTYRILGVHLRTPGIAPRPRRPLRVRTLLIAAGLIAITFAMVRRSQWLKDGLGENWPIVLMAGSVFLAAVFAVGGSVIVSRQRTRRTRVVAALVTIALSLSGNVALSGCLVSFDSGWNDWYAYVGYNALLWVSPAFTVVTLVTLGYRWEPHQLEESSDDAASVTRPVSSEPVSIIQ